jgi:hypothetical protein
MLLGTGSSPQKAIILVFSVDISMEYFYATNLKL